MISIKKISHKTAENYLELARGNYYLGGGEPPGHWHGNGAAALGLKGRMTRAQFENLFHGHSPDGKTNQIQNAGKMVGDQKRVPGWYLTFSPPKSVSIIWEMTSEHERRAIERAHDEAVQITLSIME